MKALLVIISTYDGEIEVYYNGRVENHLAAGLMRADGVYSHKEDARAMAMALTPAHEVDRDDPEGPMEYAGLLDGCELAPGAPVPACDHVIRVYEG